MTPNTNRNSSTMKQTAASSKAASATPIGAREYHTDEELGTLALRLDGLRQSVEYLESRLAGVLQPHGPESAATEGDDEYRVPLANTIRSNRRAVEDISARITSITARLEI